MFNVARKTHEEKEKTRRAILDSALDLIYERGYAATNLQDIAEHMDATRGAVYWHFKNKQDLFFTLTDEIDAEIDDILTKWAGEVGDLDGLKAFFLRYIDLMKSNDRYFKYLTIIVARIEWSEELGRVATAFKKQSEELQSFCQSRFRKAERAGVLRKGLDKRMAAKSLITLVEALLGELCPPFGKRDTKQAEVALDVFFEGIRKRNFEE